MLKPWNWKRGQSGNPAGKPKGSRTKLGEQFFADLYEVWLEKGESVIQQLLKNDPATFFNAIVRLMPRNITLNDERDPTTSPEQRAAALMGAFKTLIESGHLRPDGSGALLVGGRNLAGGSGSGAGQIIDIPPLSEADGIPCGGSEIPGAPADGEQPDGQDLSGVP